MRRRGRLSLPFPPSVNGYWRSIPAGSGTRQIISAKGREFRGMVGLRCRLAQAYGTRMDGRLDVKIRLHPPDKRLRDIDNYCKAVLDALTEAQVWLDDSQIDKLTIVRGEARRYGEAVVDITEDPVRSPLDRDIGSGYL